MKIGIYGTSIVGQTLGGQLAELGHAAMIGTRDVAKTMGRSDPHPFGLPSFSAWLKQIPGFKEN